MAHGQANICKKMWYLFQSHKIIDTHSFSVFSQLEHILWSKIISNNSVENNYFLN